MELQVEQLSAQLGLVATECTAMAQLMTDVLGGLGKISDVVRSVQEKGDAEIH